jgi:hypothetical protein
MVDVPDWIALAYLLAVIPFDGLPTYYYIQMSFIEEYIVYTEKIPGSFYYKLLFPQKWPIV